jgi:DEAD/DEAH box helicase domain-containing protein
MAGDTIVYDIETKNSFQEVGSRDPKKLQISMIGMFSYADGEFYSFTEDELPLFFRRLETADLIVGFNNKGFDDQVVSAYFPEIMKIPSFDMLEAVHKALGFRVKLDNLAHATLGTGKSGDGLKAIRLYQEGKIEELRSYCLDDVVITRDLYERGKEQGRLSYSDLTGTKEVFVDFSPPGSKVEALNLSLF